MSVNKVILVGHLGQDPELKHTPSGDAVAAVSIATNKKWKDKQGAPQEKTEWHRCVLWRKTAELAAQYLKKGSQVYFEGELETRSWDDKDGKKCYTTEVVVSSMQFIGSGNGGGGSRPPLPSSAPSSSGSAPTFGGDDDGPL